MIVIGLGNPGSDYIGTRHNVGRDLLSDFQDKKNIGEWKDNKKNNTREAKGLVGKKNVRLILSEFFMNDSGKAISKVIKDKKTAKKLVVIHDDIDLPLGKIRISYNRGSGGHRGVDSIIKALKTEEFGRIRVGVALGTKSGKIKKPEGNKVIDFILGKFSPSEAKEISEMKKDVFGAIEHIASEGIESAMGKYNS